MNTGPRCNVGGVPLSGMVVRVRINPAEIGRPLVESEYVAEDLQGALALTPEAVIEWTTDRWLARVLPWEAAQELAVCVGFPAHAVVVASQPVVVVGGIVCSVSEGKPLTGMDAYARLEHEREMHDETV